MASVKNLGERIKTKFSLNELNIFQTQCMEYVLNERDIFISTKTGSGKSLCYQGLLEIWQELQSDKNMVLVVSPLLAIDWLLVRSLSPP